MQSRMDRISAAHLGVPVQLSLVKTSRYTALLKPRGGSEGRMSRARIGRAKARRRRHEDRILGRRRGCPIVVGRAEHYLCIAVTRGRTRSETCDETALSEVSVMVLSTVVEMVVVVTQNLEPN